MKITILEKIDENTYMVMSDDGQTAIVTDEDIERLRNMGNLHEYNTEQKENL
jgi:membrane-anchored protein YejM (alkaline phosphatase superfamily)